MVELEEQMLKAAESLDFERAAGLRDQIKELEACPDVGDAGRRQRKPRPGTPRATDNATRRRRAKS